MRVAELRESDSPGGFTVKGELLLLNMVVCRWDRKHADAMSEQARGRELCNPLRFARYILVLFFAIAFFLAVERGSSMETQTRNLLINVIVKRFY